MSSCPSAFFVTPLIAIIGVLAVQLSEARKVDNTRVLVTAVLVEYAREIATPATPAEVAP